MWIINSYAISCCVPPAVPIWIVKNQGTPSNVHPVLTVLGYKTNDTLFHPHSLIQHDLAVAMFALAML